MGNNVFEYSAAQQCHYSNSHAKINVPAHQHAFSLQTIGEKDELIQNYEVVEDDDEGSHPTTASY